MNEDIVISLTYLLPGPSLVGGAMALCDWGASKGPRALAPDCCKRWNHAPCMIFRILGLKCTKFDFAEGAYSAPQTSQLDLRGPTSKGIGGMGR